MLLGLSKIIDSPGASVPFSTSVDLSDLRYGISCPVSEPVLAQGVVRNTAGVLLMKGSVTTTIHGICDRCAAEFTRDIDFPIDVVLVTELASEENEDEWVFVLNLDSKLLCKEDCKGLCPRCGKNLNDGKCTCEKELDPRLAALRQFLAE